MLHGQPWNPPTPGGLNEKITSRSNTEAVGIGDVFVPYAISVIFQYSLKIACEGI